MSRSSRFIDVFTVVVLIAGSIVIGRFYLAQRERKSGSPAELTELAGRDIATVARSDSGLRAIRADTGSIIIYVFATTRSWCSQQRVHIARLLGGAGGHRIVTASDEPAALTTNYWSDTELRDTQPIALSDSVVGAIDARAVPRLYYLRDGKIRRVLLGTVLEWGPGEFEAEARKAFKS